MTKARRFLKEVYGEWSAHNAPQWAATVAYHTIFSLAPILLIAISLAGLLFGAEAARGEIVGQIGGILGAKASEAVEELLRGFQSAPKSAFAVFLGTLVLLWGASNVFDSLRQSIDFLWDLKRKRGGGLRGWVKERVLSFALVLGVGFVLLVSLVLSAAMVGFRKALDLYLPFSAWTLPFFDALISFVVVSLLFILIFKFLPSVVMAWRDAAVGAVVTSALFIAGKSLLGLYLGRSAVTSSYGAAGSLILILLWVNYSAQILFVGACVIKVAARWSRHPLRPGPYAQRQDPVLGPPSTRAEFLQSRKRRLESAGAGAA